MAFLEKVMMDRLKTADEDYAVGQPQISDIDYDLLKTEFKERYPRNPYNNTVGVSVSGDKVKLPVTLGSLNKVKVDGSCQKWMDENQGDKVYWAKLDGVSGYVEYVDGKYHRALTRGDGEYGQDITNKLVGVVPLNLNEPVTGSYRCEIMLTDNLSYKTKRNGAAGILNRDGVKECEYLAVLFYELIDEVNLHSAIEDEISRIHYMEDLGLPLAPYVFGGVEEVDYLVELLRDWKEHYSYDIDGVVIVLNNSEREDTYYPELKCAFKVNEEAIVCDVVGLTWQVGRTGRVVPVVNIKPTEIGGVTVSNVTGHNAKTVFDGGIDDGAKIGVFRSGEVIPYLDYVAESVGWSFNESCPSCGNELIWKGVDLVCKSTYCPERDVQVVEHFLTTLGVENVTAVTLLKLGIRDIEDVYRLDPKDIAKLDGFGTKRAEQIITEVQKSLSTTPDKLLSSFGISGIGKTASQNILKVYDFKDVWKLTVDDLKKVDGIGCILAQNFVNSINNFSPLYDHLKSKGLNWSTATNKLSGQMFCLTGKAPMKRDTLVQMIESNGGYVKNFSRKIDFLVTDDINSISSKTKRSKENNIPIILYEDLMKML